MTDVFRFKVSYKDEIYRVELPHQVITSTQSLMWAIADMQKFVLEAQEALEQAKKDWL